MGRGGGAMWGVQQMFIQREKCLFRGKNVSLEEKLIIAANMKVDEL